MISGRTAYVRLDDETVIEATPDQLDLEVGREVTVAVRPEKITLVQETFMTDTGEHELPEEDKVSTAEILMTMERERNKTLIPGEVIFANYIGTDTRYIVRIGQKTDVVVRIQNFGTRFETIYRKGQHVKVYWATPNARVLVQ